MEKCLIVVKKHIHVHIIVEPLYKDTCLIRTLSRVTAIHREMHKTTPEMRTPH